MQKVASSGKTRRMRQLREVWVRAVCVEGVLAAVFGVTSFGTATVSFASSPYSRLKLTIVRSSDCPVSVAYDSHVRQLVSDYSSQIKIEIADVGSQSIELKDETIHQGAALLAGAAAWKRVEDIKAHRTPFAALETSSGSVLYSGGLGSESKPGESTTLYLKNAIEQALNGKPVLAKKGRTLGCALKKPSSF